MLHLLAAPLLAAALCVVRPLPPGTNAHAPALPGTDSALSCDDGSMGGTLVQRLDAYYGNRFELGCASARITSVQFTHFGAGRPGPYAYRLHLLDAACRETGVTGLLTTPSAALEPATTSVDVAALAWCASGSFAVMVEPLSCADGLSGQDCFPALVVDATSDPEAGAHCGVVSAETSSGRACLAPRSADGRYYDFLLRVGIACNDPACTTGVRPATWSTLKRLYRDPRPALAE